MIDGVDMIGILDIRVDIIADMVDIVDVADVLAVVAVVDNVG